MVNNLFWEVAKGMVVPFGAGVFNYHLKNTGIYSFEGKFLYNMCCIFIFMEMNSLEKVILGNFKHR